MEKKSTERVPGGGGEFQGEVEMNCKGNSQESIKRIPAKSPSNKGYLVWQVITYEKESFPIEILGHQTIYITFDL